jgi:hypothetical protein
LADLHYPSGRRELLKLWWDGGGNATVRSLRDRIEFIVDGTTTLVPVPDAPMTVSEFAAHLQRSVKNAGGQTGLKAELFFTGADSLEDHELAPGSVFADEGDALDPDLDTTLTEEAYTAQAAVAKPLGPSTGDPYVLFHAHKAQQAVRFDQNGATLDADELTPQFDGIGGVASLAGTHTVTLAPGPGVSRFTRVFRAGDLIEVPQGGLRRVVVSVDSDFSLTVATPFPAAVPAGSTYRRVALDHRAPLLPPAGAQVMTPVDAFGSPIPDQLAVAPGPAVAFGAMFRPGDSIRVHLVPGNLALDQTRVVVDVLSDGVLLLGREFDPTNPAAVGPFGFERIGREPEHLFGFLATGDDTLDSGQTLMNHAADLAAMLCLSATSQMLAPDALAAARVGSTGDLKRVVQVLRNWNLDRRRQNEWKMLVQGGALSEKRGDASALDPALPPLPAGWSLLAGEGEATSNSLGWVNLLRSWVDMARRPESDALADTSFRPGAPSNKALSQAMAYLFDMPDPVA